MPYIFKWERSTIVLLCKNSLISIFVDFSGLVYSKALRTLIQKLSKEKNLLLVIYIANLTKNPFIVFLGIDACVKHHIFQVSDTFI